MPMQYSVAINNARLDSIETVIGTAAILKIYTGAIPANCAAAATGTLLASFSLPLDYFSAASAGVKSKLGTWSGSASAAGTAGYARITDSVGTSVGIQGTCGIGSGDFQMDNTSLAASQVVTVTAFSITASQV